MSTRICLFWHRFWDLIFPPIFLDLGSSLGSIWHHFSIILASFFRAWLLHKCFIDFGMDLDVIFDGFWYLSRSHMQPSKPSKTIVFTMKFNDFTILRNMFLDDFPSLFRDKFLHWFLMSCCIYFGSLLVPFWYQCSCFRDIYFSMFFWNVSYPNLFKNSFQIYLVKPPFSEHFRFRSGRSVP